jgi:DNA-binding response OmpR family regulator
MARLRQEGYDAQAVDSGEAGLDALDAFEPDAVLLDQHLPGMNGLEFLGRLRRQGSSARVIMMSGDDSRELVANAMRAGACDFLCKPFTLVELERRLRHAIAPGSSGPSIVSPDAQDRRFDDRRNKAVPPFFPLKLSNGIWLLTDRRITRRRQP